MADTTEDDLIKTLNRRVHALGGKKGRSGQLGHFRCELGIKGWVGEVEGEAVTGVGGCGEATRQTDNPTTTTNDLRNLASFPSSHWPNHNTPKPKQTSIYCSKRLLDVHLLAWRKNCSNQGNLISLSKSYTSP